MPRLLAAFPAVAGLQQIVDRIGGGVDVYSALSRMVLLSEYNVAAPEDVPGSSPPQHFANRSFWRYGECSGSLYSVVV